jgi:hypothetical protein
VESMAWEPGSPLYSLIIQSVAAAAVESTGRQGRAAAHHTSGDKSLALKSTDPVSAVIAQTVHHALGGPANLDLAEEDGKEAPSAGGMTLQRDATPNPPSPKRALNMMPSASVPSPPALKKCE